MKRKAEDELEKDDGDAKEPRIAETGSGRAPLSLRIETGEAEAEAESVAAAAGTAATGTLRRVSSAGFNRAPVSQN